MKHQVDAMEVTRVGEMDNLEGVWTCSSWISGGVSPRDEVRASLRLELTGTHLRMFRAGKFLGERKYVIDESKDPNQIDLVSLETEGKTIPGIYSLEGDTLILCAELFGENRPKAFTSEPGTWNDLKIWKRVDPDSGDEMRAEAGESPSSAASHHIFPGTQPRWEQTSP